MSRTFVRLLLAASLALAVALLSWQWGSAHYEERFEERVEQLRRAGEPVGPVAAAPPVADDENAAVPLAAAGRWYEAHAPLIPNDFPSLERPDDAGRARLEAWILELRPFFALVQEAADRPHYAFDDGEDLEFAVLGAIWSQSLLRMRVWYGVHAGHDKEELLRCCRAAWRFAGTPVGSPIDASLWFEREAVVDCIAELALHRGVDGLAERVEPWLLEAEDPGELDRSLVAARTELIRVVRDLAAGRTKPGLPDLSWGSGRLVRMIDSSAALRASRPFLYRDGARAIDRLERVRAALAEDSDRDRAARLAALGPPSSGLLRGFDRTVDWSVGAWRDLRAQARITRLGIALLRHRETAGDWPATLADVTPPVPDALLADPRTGRPFVYERGVSIASAGSDPQPVRFELR